MISSLVTAGVDGGYLVNSRLAKVHWQAGDRTLAAPAVSVAGESALWIDTAEIPSDRDVARLGQALAAGVRGDRDELMAITAAYSGLRWGELVALTVGQVNHSARAITVHRKVAEVAGHLFLEAPKNRKHRRTIYPRRTPAGYPLAERLAARIEEARAEQEAGTNPLGLLFPSPKGMCWRSSNFSRQVLKRACLAAGWRDAFGSGKWTWHRPRVLHLRPVHLEARPHRRLPHCRSRHLPHDPRPLRAREEAPGHAGGGVHPQFLEVTGGGRARDFEDIRDHAIIRVFTAGARRTEVAQMELDDLSADLIARPFARVVPLKDARAYGEGRVVPFAVSTGRAVAAYARVRRSHLPALWLGTRGRGPMTGSGIYQMVKRRTAEAGYDPAEVWPHQWRDTVANDWLAGGGAEGDLMRLMGWTDRSMLNRYAEDLQVQRAFEAKRRRGNIY